jgi:hypothetical protein
MIEEYRNGLAQAGLEHIQIVDSDVDLNAYAKVENQAGCCSPAMDGNTASCCSPSPATLHEELKDVLSTYDVNQGGASVKIYALKPNAKSCCGSNCCA